MNAESTKIAAPRSDSSERSEEVGKTGYGEAYSSPIISTRVGALFNAHPYPTKINPEAIVPFILAHSRPGELVVDGFAGTGATAIASQLCDNPPASLVAQVAGVISAPEWGPRRSVVFDLSPLAYLIGETLLHPPVRRSSR